MSVDYQRHGRRHRPGGEDPIPGMSELPWCGIARTSAVTVDTGSSFDTDAFVDWQTFGQAGDTSYFSEMTDGNGVEGVKIGQPGLYSVQSFVQVTEANASNYVPPTLRWMVAYAIDGTDDFGTGAYGPSLTGGWIAHNPAASPYVPPSIAPVASKMVLGGAFTWAFTSDELANYGDSITCRIVSEGGADDWTWCPAALWIYYLGPVAE